jgi:hypothetical protein
MPPLGRKLRNLLPPQPILPSKENIRIKLADAKQLGKKSLSLHSMAYTIAVSLLINYI